ncbi:hypothetical protein BT93_L4058 [Corymbia citriodora subsp. variegata]|uniref:Uncharacterized protein n=1 Tax=Corymbia citriodora subsp. variegata TaxID=360336 RepID=A0A8T0CUU6_CORYI|nr:hypothetical protein BT93_L4058 [Corymbia citriodora subsp. variegata]
MEIAYGARSVRREEAVGKGGAHEEAHVRIAGQVEILDQHRVGSWRHFQLHLLPPHFHVIFSRKLTHVLSQDHLLVAHRHPLHFFTTPLLHSLSLSLSLSLCLQQLSDKWVPGLRNM